MPDTDPSPRPDVPPADGPGGHRRGPRRRVEVVGSGAATATPDVVRVHVSLRTDADDVAGALRSTGRLVTALGAAAREHAVASTDLSTVGAGVYPRHDRDGQHVVGYQSSHQLVVLVRDTERVSEVIEAFAAVAGNALGIDTISLDLADTSALEEAAREAAFAHARTKAEQFATLAGARLGAVLSVTEGGGGGGWPAPVGRMKMASVALDSMPVEAGQHSVSATVAVTFALEDR